MITYFFLFDATRLLVFLFCSRGHYVRESLIMLGWFLAKYPDFLKVDDIPDLQAKELISTLAVNDFEVVLLAMKN
jgi:hypothetical protein